MHSKQFIVHDFSRSAECLGFLEAGEADFDLKPQHQTPGK